MEIGRGHYLVVKVFVEVSFAIIVSVMKYGDLISTGYIDLIIYYLNAHRLIQTRSKAFPKKGLRISLQAIH